jgi:hypothetical protein
MVYFSKMGLTNTEEYEEKEMSKQEKMQEGESLRNFCPCVFGLRDFYDNILIQKGLLYKIKNVKRTVIFLGRVESLKLLVKNAESSSQKSVEK